MTHFYYNDYPFREDKNYLIYFRGAFNPVSRGHFSLLERYIHLPNVKYLISQIGDHERHGVPFNLSYKIWQIYIRELLPDMSDKIFIKQTETSQEILSFIDNIDCVIFIRGKEFPEKEREKREREYSHQYKKLKKDLKSYGVSLAFLFIDRPEKETLSSSKFVAALLERKSIEEISFFLPDLPASEIDYIIKKLSKQNLKL